MLQIEGSRVRPVTVAGIDVDNLTIEARGSSDRHVLQATPRDVRVVRFGSPSDKGVDEGGREREGATGLVDCWSDASIPSRVGDHGGDVASMTHVSAFGSKAVGACHRGSRTHLHALTWDSSGIRSLCAKTIDEQESPPAACMSCSFSSRHHFIFFFHRVSISAASSSSFLTKK